MNMIKVTKRNGKREPVVLDKILDRINQQTYGLDQKWITPFEIAQKVIEGITPDIETRVLDILAMETSAALTTKHPDYAILAARLAITALHKETKKGFSETVYDLYHFYDVKKDHKPIVSKDFYELVMANKDELDSAIIHSRDHNFDYFGYKTLEKSYLLKINGKVAERPQYMYMRTALQLWNNNIPKVIETYNLLSEGLYTHATPTLFNSGTTRTQLSSCFLLSVNDSIEGIFDNIKECALISKNAGGIGIDFSKIRGKGSYISGTNGSSNGIIPFLKIYNEVARAVDQCFLGETTIKTSQGDKKIEDIKKGDLVKTSDNTYHKVLDIKETLKESEEIVILKTSKGVTKVTKGHQILVLRNLPKKIIKEDIILGLKQNIYTPTWISACEVLTTDKIIRY